MSDEGPYRRAGATACPACSEPLSPAEGGQRTCPRGCGSWTDAAVVEERWGDSVDIDGDGRLRWRVPKVTLSCIVCSQPMRRVVHATWSSHRCREHGVWFERDARARFEAQMAAAIHAHAAQVQELTALTALIVSALSGDGAAARSLAGRLLVLERVVERQSRELEELRRTVPRV